MAVGFSGRLGGVRSQARDAFCKRKRRKADKPGMLFIGWATKQDGVFGFIPVGSPAIATAGGAKEQVYLCEKCGAFVYDASDDVDCHYANCIEDE